MSENVLKTSVLVLSDHMSCQVMCTWTDRIHTRDEFHLRHLADISLTGPCYWNSCQSLFETQSSWIGLEFIIISRAHSVASVIKTMSDAIVLTGTICCRVCLTENLLACACVYDECHRLNRIRWAWQQLLCKSSFFFEAKRTVIDSDSQTHSMI